MAKPIVEVAITADGSVFVREVDKSTESAKKLGDQVTKTGKSAKDAEGSMKSYAERLRDATNTAGKFVAGMTAAGAALGVAFVKRGLESVDTANRLATALGITVESYSALSYSAKLAGVEQSTLDGGMKRLAKSVTDAAAGSEKSASAFAALHLNASELLKLPADKQMGLVADALNRVENASQRAALAQAVLGKSGTDLIPMLRGGSEGLAAMAREAATLGLNLSQVEAAEVDAAGDALDKIAAGSEGFSQQLALQFAPVISDLGERFLGVTDKMGGMREIAAQVFDALITGAGYVANALVGLEVGWLKFREAAQSAAAFVAQGFDSLVRLLVEAWNRLPWVDKIDYQGSAIAGFLDSMKAGAQEAHDKVDAILSKPLPSEQVKKYVEETRAKFAAQARDAVAGQGAVQGALIKSTEITGNLAKGTDELAKKQEAALKKLNDQVAGLYARDAALRMNERDQARLAAQIELTNAAADGNIVVTDAMRQEVDKLAASNHDAEAAIDAQKKAMEAATKAVDPWKEAITDAVSRVDQAFVDFWKSAGSGFDDFSDKLKDGFKQLLAELAHQNFTRPIVEQIGKMFGLGGTSGTPGGTGSGGGLGGIFGGSGGGFNLGTLSSIWKWGQGVFSGFQSGGMSGAWGAATSPLSGMFGGGSSAIVGYTPAGAPITAGGTTSFSGAGAGSGFSAAGAGWAALAVGIVNTLKDWQSGLYKPADTLTGHSLDIKYADRFNDIIPNLGDVLFHYSNPLRFVTNRSQADWGKLGVQVGGTPDQDAEKTVMAASGLSLSAVAKRTSDEASAQLLDTFLSIDQALTEAARGAGLSVDFKGRSFGNTSLSVDHDGPKNAFGLGDRLDNNSWENFDIAKVSDDFAREWIAQLGDQVSDRLKGILGDVSKKSAPDIIKSFGIGSKLDELLGVDVLDTVATNAEAASKTILDAYGEATQSVVDLSAEYDGTTESLAELTDALGAQKQVAVALAEQYRQVEQAVNATFGDAIAQIENSLLSSDALYGKLRGEISTLTAELESTIDPARIAELSGQINNLALSAWNLLDEGQRAALGNEFVSFLEDARELATAQIDEGRDSLTGRETALADAIDLELLAQAAATQQQAANTQQQAATDFAAAVAQFRDAWAGGISLNLGGINWEVNTP